MNANRTIVLVVAVLVVGGVPVALAASTSGAESTTTAAEAVEDGAVYAQDGTTADDGQDETTTVENGDAAADGEETTAAAGDAVTNITFADQTSNGSAVVVEQVALQETKPPGGFVTIHLADNVTDDVETETVTDDDAETVADDAGTVETTPAADTDATTAGSGGVNVTEEMLGERIGATAFLDPGDYENLTVQLDQTLEEDAMLIAVVHQDAQGDEQFDPEADQPFEVDGQIVADAANVTVSDADGATTVGDEETVVDDGNATTEDE